MATEFQKKCGSKNIKVFVQSYETDQTMENESLGIITRSDFVPSMDNLD